MEYFTYVIQSEIDGRLYKGQTEDINIRIAQHNAGKTKSTKGYLPLKLVYFEKFYTREEALQRKKFFKSGVGREFLKSKLNER